MTRYASTLNQPQTIIVNGTTMLLKDYKAMKKGDKPTTKKRVQKTYTSVTILAEQVEPMVKKIEVIDSLVAYYSHGYKQWGTIANELMNTRFVKKPLMNVVIGTKDLKKMVENITTMAKKNDKDTFQYIEKLAWKVDDIKTALDQLTEGIIDSRIMTRFGKHECINGTGKRLGLRVLVQRSTKAIRQMEKTCKELIEIAKNGVDVFEYTANGKRWIA